MNASVLHEAVADISADNLDNKTAVVQTLQIFGYDMNVTDDCGYTALQCVAGKRHLQIVKALVDGGADGNAETDGMRPLDRAADTISFEKVEFRLQKEAQVNTREGGCEGMGMAAGNGHTAMVRLLLDHGAKASNRPGFGCELLQAARSGNAETISLLYERGFAHQGLRSLYSAVIWDSLSVIKLLLAQGVNIKAISRSGRSFLHVAALRWQYNRRETYDDCSPRREVLQYLLDQGLDTKIRDNTGQTAKDIAVASNHIEPVEILEPRSPNMDLIYKSDLLAKRAACLDDFHWYLTGYKPPIP